MPYDSIEVSDCLTDSLSVWLSTKWQQLRDNLETFHDHTPGKGKLIGRAGINLTGSVSGKFADKAATGRKMLLTYEEEKDAGTIAAPTGSATLFDDTGTDLSITVDVNSVIEVHYQFYVAVGFEDTERWSTRLYLNGSEVADTRRNFEVEAGYDIVTHIDVAAGTHALKWVWQKEFNAAGRVLQGPRKQLAIAYGRA